MLTTKEVLQRARAVIDEPEHWCQGWFAQDRIGNNTRPDMFDAFAFCSIGAIRKVLYDEEIHSVMDEVEAILALALCVEKSESLDRAATVVTFNDSNDHKAVLAAFDCAINKL